MENKEKNTQNSYSGKQGENGIIAGYEKLWDRLKEDLGIINIVILFFGSILLIFSPEKGWEFDILFLNYTLAYRGWIGIFCFLYVIVSLFVNKRFNRKKINSKEYLEELKLNKQEVIKNETIVNEPLKKSNVLIKSMYVHFSSKQKDKLILMSGQLSICDDHASAMLLLTNFKTLYNGKLYFSPFPQSFALNKSIATKGENEKEWCWWYWDGGNDGFQLLVSLCQ